MNIAKSAARRLRAGLRRILVLVLSRLCGPSVLRTTAEWFATVLPEDDSLSELSAKYVEIRGGARPFERPAHYWALLHLLHLHKTGRCEATYTLRFAQDRLPPLLLHVYRDGQSCSLILSGGLYALPFAALVDDGATALLFEDSLSLQPPSDALVPEFLMATLRWVRWCHRWPVIASVLPLFHLACPVEDQNDERAELHLMFGFTNNFGHYIWNELTGKYLLRKAAIVPDRVVQGPYDFGDMAGQHHEAVLKASVAEKSVCERSRHCRFRFNDLVISREFSIGLRDELGSAPRPDAAQPKGLCFKVRTRGRRFENQIAIFVDIIRWLDTSYGARNVELLFDGHTSFGALGPDGLAAIEEELDCVERIMKAVGPRPDARPSRVLIGMSLREKSVEFGRIGQYVAPIGSGAELHGWVFGIPGIYFGPMRMIRLSHQHRAGFIEDSPVMQWVEPTREWGTEGCESFEMDSKDLREALLRTRYLEDLGRATVGRTS